MSRLGICPKRLARTAIGNGSSGTVKPAAIAALLARARVRKMSRGSANSCLGRGPPDSHWSSGSAMRSAIAIWSK
eukprot:990619-Alexandrium_andersonii.AAC.1